MVLDILTSNPEVWSKTVFLIMYDENDGYFDHVVAPTAPASAAQGASTVDTAGEFNSGDGQPFGLGPRVPLFAISPWSTGGYVCSQVFDHTSVIRFLEQRFGVMEPNISPWRRAVCGDLTTAFDFANPNPAVPKLPDTRPAISKAAATRHLPEPQQSPHQAMPVQEPGTRPARPIPYALSVNGQDGGGGQFNIAFANTGSIGSSFHLYDLKSNAAPLLYTIGAGDTLAASCTPGGTGGAYSFRVQGANGFVRWFSGTVGDLAQPQVTLNEDAATGSVCLHIVNRGSAAITVQVADAAYGAANQSKQLQGGASWTLNWPLDASAQWYDLQVTTTGDAAFQQRFAGHVETGKVSSSDPANY
jgi:phospholipase C